MPVLIVLAAVLGLGVGAAVNRAAGAFPWQPSSPSGAPPGRGPEPGSGVGLLQRPAALAVRPPVVESATAALFALTASRFGPSWELPAFLLLAGVAVLLTVIDLQHRLLPNRVVLPALAAGAVLLTVAAAGTGDWPALGRAGLGATVLFVGFLTLALISPAGLGMGDVKLAAVLGLHLGWVGWLPLALGAVAGFVVQGLLALLLLAGRRAGLKSELPFGPAMLLGAGLALGLPA